MPHIRPYRPEDNAGLLDVCTRTGDAGADATGILSDDELWGLIYAVPYGERHPDLAWVVESDDGRVIGYTVGTDDTDAFEAWFHDEWWPRFQGRFPLPEQEETREEKLIGYASRRGTTPDPDAAAYPGHLHINLLPETQGHGLGRRLIETLLAELGRRGVPAVHLGVDPRNDSASAFYEHIGMHPLPAEPGDKSYGIRLDA